MTKYESHNAYTAEHFPDDWSEEDVAFLAEFVEAEFGARLQAVLSDERSYDYELYRRVTDE